MPANVNKHVAVVLDSVFIVFILVLGLQMSAITRNDRSGDPYFASSWPVQVRQKEARAGGAQSLCFTDERNLTFVDVQTPFAKCPKARDVSESIDATVP